MNTQQELTTENAALRGILERVLPSLAARVKPPQAIGGVITGDQLIAEQSDLAQLLVSSVLTGKLHVGVPVPNQENADLETQRAALKADREQLNADRAAFDAAVSERVAVELAATVAQLGFTDRREIYATATPDAKLTATQEVLKAKGLPLNTEIRIASTSPATQS